MVCIWIIAVEGRGQRTDGVAVAPDDDDDGGERRKGGGKKDAADAGELLKWRPVDV